jgi:hypothetical protein
MAAALKDDDERVLKRRALRGSAKATSQLLAQWGSDTAATLASLDAAALRYDIEGDLGSLSLSASSHTSLPSLPHANRQVTAAMLRGPLDATASAPEWALEERSASPQRRTKADAARRVRSTPVLARPDQWVRTYDEVSDASLAATAMLSGNDSATGTIASVSVFGAARDSRQRAEARRRRRRQQHATGALAGPAPLNGGLMQPGFAGVTRRLNPQRVPPAVTAFWGAPHRLREAPIVTAAGLSIGAFRLPLPGDDDGGGGGGSTRTSRPAAAPIDALLRQAAGAQMQEDDDAASQRTPGQAGEGDGLPPADALWSDALRSVLAAPMAAGSVLARAAGVRVDEAFLEAAAGSNGGVACGQVLGPEFSGHVRSPRTQLADIRDNGLHAFVYSGDAGQAAYAIQQAWLKHRVRRDVAAGLVGRAWRGCVKRTLLLLLLLYY